MQKTQTILMSIQELLVPATFILMTSAPCRFPFLQNPQLLNNHFQKTLTLKTSIQELQVPTTPAHCKLPFLQNTQLQRQRS